MDPNAIPHLCGKCRAECARGIHAHSRDRDFYANVNHHKRTSEQARVTVEPPCVRHRVSREKIGRRLDRKLV